MKRRAFFSRLIGGAAVAANPQAVTTLMQTAAPKVVTSSVAYCSGLMSVVEIPTVFGAIQYVARDAESARKLLEHKKYIERVLVPVGAHAGRSTFSSPGSGKTWKLGGPK